MTPQSDAQVFRFRPAPERSEPTPCSCAYRADTCKTVTRVACAHVEHRYVGGTPVECLEDVHVSASRLDHGKHRHHVNERAKVMAKLESQPQRDGFVLTATEPDGTLVYEQRAQPKRRRAVR